MEGGKWSPGYWHTAQGRWSEEWRERGKHLPQQLKRIELECVDG